MQAQRVAARSGRLWRWLFGVVVAVVVHLQHRRAGNMRRRFLDELRTPAAGFLPWEEMCPDGTPLMTTVSTQGPRVLIDVRRRVGFEIVADAGQHVGELAASSTGIRPFKVGPIKPFSLHRHIGRLAQRGHKTRRRQHFPSSAWGTPSSFRFLAIGLPSLGSVSVSAFLPLRHSREHVLGCGVC